MCSIICTCGSSKLVVKPQSQGVQGQFFLLILNYEFEMEICKSRRHHLPWEICCEEDLLQLMTPLSTLRSATWLSPSPPASPGFFFFFNFIFIFYFLYCSGFCHTLKWNSHGFTCVPHPDPPSHLPLHPIPPGLPSTPVPSACLMHPTWSGDLFHPT